MSDIRNKGRQSRRLQKRRSQIALNIGLRHPVAIKEELLVHSHTRLDARRQ